MWATRNGQQLNMHALIMSPWLSVKGHGRSIGQRPAGEPDPASARTAHAVLHHAKGPVLISRRPATAQDAQDGTEKL